MDAVHPMAAGLRQADRAHTVAHRTAAERTVDRRRHTAVAEAQLMLAGLLVTVGDLLAGQLLPMEEADQRQLTVEAAIPADLAAEAVDMHHPEAEAATAVVGVEATAAADVTKANSLITQSRPYRGGFSIWPRNAS